MDVHTRSADIPVMLSSHVKTIPSPHIVVRKVRNENASERLGYYVRVVKVSKDLRNSQQRGDGHASTVYPSKYARRIPCPGKG